MNPKNATNNLAIIGASGTGKTTLAVGLYATSTKAFTVSPIGDETRKYLEIRQTSIQEGFWPAATNESENFDLRLGLHATGRRTDIVFREYMGERMKRDPNYIREVIGMPKSAMILFNPGMPGLDKPEPRTQMIGNLKKIAQHLKDNGCIAVAFVVTASDRLASDLKDFREDFEAYASEVTNHLTNLRLNWKRFDVTVSGQLEDQNKPKLARGENNTTHEPVLWLLDRIRVFDRNRSIVAAAATAAICLGIAGATFAGLVAHSRSRLGKAERALDSRLDALAAAFAISNEADVRSNAVLLATTNRNESAGIMTFLPADRARKDQLLKRTDKQRDLWGVRVLALEFALRTNAVAAKPLTVPLEWFNEFNNGLISSSPDFTDAVAELDALTNAWTAVRVDLESRCQLAHFRYDVERESNNLDTAKPEALVEPLKKALELMTDKNRQYSLVTNRTELCAGLSAARTNAIARYVDSKTTWEKEDTTPPGNAQDIIRTIRKELKTALNSEEFANLETIVEERRSSARAAWEQYQFPERRKAQLDELKASSDSPSDALKSSLDFLRSMDVLFPSIPETVRTAARTAVTNERAAAINRYLDRLANFKPEDDEPPAPSEELQNTARKDLKSALTDSESETLSDLLAARCSEARRSWDAYHFQKRASELETALKTAGARPATPLRNSLAFLTSMTNDYPTISQADFIRARESLTQARNAALAAYGKSIADNWDVNGREPPEFDGNEIRDTILTKAVVTDEEASAFRRDMEKLFAETSEKWREKQKKLVDDFSVTGDPEKLVRNFGEFFDEHPHNPYLSDLAEKADAALQKYLREFITDYCDLKDMKETERRFLKFRSVCIALTGKSLAGNPIQNLPSFKFAKLCCDEGKLNDTNRGIYAVFPEKLQITKVEALVNIRNSSDSYHGLDMALIVESFRWNFSQNNWEEVAPSCILGMKEASNSNGYGRISRDNNAWQTIWSGSTEVSFNPYSFPAVVVAYEDRLGGIVSVDVSGDDVFFLSGYVSGRLSTTELDQKDIILNHTTYGSTEGTLKLRVTAQRIGKDFSDFAKEVNLIR